MYYIYCMYKIKYIIYINKIDICYILYMYYKVYLLSICILLMLMSTKSNKTLHLRKSNSSSFRIEMLAHLTSEGLWGILKMHICIQLVNCAAFRCGAYDWIHTVGYFKMSVFFLFTFNFRGCLLWKASTGLV